MEKLAVWSEHCPVRFNAIDSSNTMTLSAVMGFLQEAAISHAENLGVGRRAMASSNQVWILSRMSVQIDCRPAFGETVTVRTWPRGWEKLYALRDYDILNLNDVPVRARSYWIIIDMEKRRPLRPHSVMDYLPLNEGMDALESAVNLAENPNLEKKGERGALYTDVDYNGHVNNVSYIRWIEDALDPGLLAKARRMKLDINYMHEVLPGEITGIWMAPVGSPAGAPAADAHHYAFEGRKIHDNQTAFRAELRLW